MPACAIAASSASCADGEVEVDRNPSGHQHGDVGERAADRRRQQQPDHPLALRAIA